MKCLGMLKDHPADNKRTTARRQGGKKTAFSEKWHTRKIAT